MIAKYRGDSASIVRATLHLLEQLESIINYDKSQIDPDQLCKFLGFILDTYFKLSISIYYYVIFISYLGLQ